MTHRNSWLYRGAAGAVACGLLAWALWPRPLLVDMVPVSRGPLVVTLDEEGETRVRERYVVSAPVAGRLLRIELEPGDRVVAGETVLAVLQPREATLLDARTRAEVEAQVHALEAELERAKHERDRVRAEVEFAKVDYERARRLSGEGVLSAEQLEIAELERKQSIENLDAAEHAVESAAYRVASTRARLLDIGNPIRGGDDPLSLHSPIDGTVLRRLHESETLVAGGEPLLEVGAVDALEVVADYLSSDAVRIHPGDRARIERWGGGAVLEARVRRIEPSGFTKISALGVEEKRVNVVFDILTPLAERQGLADGFRVEARAVVWESKDAVRAPTGGLFRQGDGWAVFVVEDGIARLRTVEIGERTPTAVEIRSGLVADELLIVHPGDDVADGERVAQRTVPY